MHGLKVKVTAMEVVDIDSCELVTQGIYGVLGTGVLISKTDSEKLWLYGSCLSLCGRMRLSWAVPLFSTADAWP